MSFDKLTEIKTRLESGEMVEPISVRDFLKWFWNSQRRGWWIVETIRDALTELGLETYPDFNSVYIDSMIQIRKIEFPNEDSNANSFESEPENIAEKPTDDVLNFDDPTYRISRLEAANKDLLSVKPDSELSEIITLMITHDFSQIPVMQNQKRGLKGVISWRSIGQKLAVGNSSLIAKDLMEPNFQLISDETSLFKALPLIIEHDYILVQNRASEICGIITASDLSLQFKQLTEPFLLVAEIENHIRQILSKIDNIEFQNSKDSQDEGRTGDSVADLTFGEYLRMLQKPEIWDKLQLPISRKIFCDELDKIREIRNSIMHFDPDGLEDKSIETLRNFVRLLQTLRSLKVF